MISRVQLYTTPEKSQEHKENLRTYAELTKSHDELQRSMTGKSSEVYQSLDKMYPDDMEVTTSEVRVYHSAYLIEVP